MPQSRTFQAVFHHAVELLYIRLGPGSPGHASYTKKLSKGAWFPTPNPLPSFPLCAYGSSSRVTCGQVTEEEKNHTQVRDAPGMYSGTTWE